MRERRAVKRPTLLSPAVLVMLGLAAPPPAEQGGVLVLKEHGGGSPTPAQPYVDKFVGMAAKLKRWDDAQRAELPHLEGGGDVHAVWESAKLPALTLAAFPTAPEAERKKFRDSLRTVCEGEGRSACAEVGVSSLEAATPADYADLVSLY